ncbi:MAG: hypothetical protein GY851_19485 [bacterium]|nr:hypothetical protein [bacterium]
MVHPIDKASVAFRIGIPLWITGTRFDELLALFERHKGLTDEITLFTSETHPPLPLPVLEERCAIAKDRMAAAREKGYRSGLNILATIGHHDEDLPNSLSADFTRATDLQGRVCQGSFCPNDPRHREYTVRIYELLVSAGPDYIWVDDDVRLYGHMPIGETCFCDTCLGLISKRTGVEYTRESLRAALAEGSFDQKAAVRRAVLQDNRETLSRLFALIERTVHALAPDMPLGFMTGDRFYEGYDFDTWAAVLAGPEGREVLWRPGGGTYRDERLDDIAGKAHDIGRQTSILPKDMQVIQSELESFPYQRLKKSAHATGLEAAAYIASGCTGTAFNVLSMYDEPLDEYEPLVTHLGATRPFLDILARTFRRGDRLGIHTGWNKDSLIANNPDGDWLAWGGAPSVRHAYEIWSTGLPAAYGASGACVTALSGDGVLALSEDEIRAALAGGVYLDGPALTRLNELGYGDLTGYTVKDVRHIDCIEEMLDHSLNGAFTGRRRNGRQSFWKCPCHCLEPTKEGTATLSRVVDYTYNETHPCCVGVFENSLGGRVCVSGYYPWEQLQNLSKSAQLKGIMRWLSKDTMPAYVESFHRANLWVTRSDEDAYGIGLINAYLDPAEDLTILVRTNRSEMRVTDMACGETSVTAAGQEGPYKRFVLPTIQPWNLVLLTV